MRDAQKLVPNASNDKEWVKEVRTEGTAAQNSAYELIDASTDLQEMVKIARGEGMLGGAHFEIKSPWGNFDLGKWTQGSWDSFLERAKTYLGDSNMSPSEIDGAVNRARDLANQQLMGSSLDATQRSIVQARLEASYLRVASAIGIALNNNSKQFSNKDFQVGEGVAGNITLTGPQNMALNQENTRRGLNSAQQKLISLSGDPNMPINWANMPADQRTAIVERMVRLGKDNNVSPDIAKQIYQAEHDNKNPGQARYLDRTGNTDEDYGKARQTEAQVTKKYAEETQRRAEETHQLNFQKYVDAKIEAQRREALAQQQAFAQAFQHIGQMLANSIKMPSMPSVNLGAGGEDTGAFRINPAPQRTPPRVATPANPFTRK